MPASRLAVSVPFDDLLPLWPDGGQPAGVEVHRWDLTGPPPGPLDVVVPGYDSHGRREALAAVPGLRWVQLLSAGYDGVPEDLPPGVGLLNGAGIHDAVTAELALALTLASLRDLPTAVREADHGRWTPLASPGLAGRRVLILGAGRIGTAICARLAPFEPASVTRVGTRAREDTLGRVHAAAELPQLLPHHDVVIVIVPLSEQTRGMVDAAFLAAMPDGALVVNVARGPVVDTPALLAELESGRLRAALDVTDPEPLPADHPLWRAPGLPLTPHVGGNTADLVPRMRAFLAAQVERLAAGEPPHNVVVERAEG
ncbi:MAG: 2-hydroxyacid dehydrogenase [Kineosporiaceae bacterium]